MDQSNNTSYDVIVIGGGASGMFAAIQASENGVRVLLLEKNKRLGEKLRITGGGRCNITNAEEDVRILLKNYGKAEKFLYSAFTKFGVKDTIDFFTKLKLPIKVEARKRAFPVSEKAADVVHVLHNKLHRNMVTIATDSQVTKIHHAEGNIQSVECGDTTYSAKSYILASGGTSRPETGATGDGFDWLADLGHTVHTPSPNITPLALKDTWVKSIAGVSAKSVLVTFYTGNDKKFKLHGDVLFTHFGISGPLILNNAYKVADLLQTDTVTAKIDCLPELDAKSLDQKIVSLLHEHGSKQLKNVLPYFVPAGLSPAIKEILATTNFDTKTSEVSKQTRAQLVDVLKNMPITIEGLMGFEKAVVADGGIALNEIDTRTMQSKKINNLYITGDLLDINRPSGGYSLQLCWTTGYVAGSHASSNLTL